MPHLMREFGTLYIRYTTLCAKKFKPCLRILSDKFPAHQWRLSDRVNDRVDIVSQIDSHLLLFASSSPFACSDPLWQVEFGRKNAGQTTYFPISLIVALPRLDFEPKAGSSGRVSSIRNPWTVAPSGTLSISVSWPICRYRWGAIC